MKTHNIIIKQQSSPRGVEASERGGPVSLFPRSPETLPSSLRLARDKLAGWEPEGRFPLCIKLPCTSPTSSQVLPPFALRGSSQKANVQNFSPPNQHVIVRTVLDKARFVLGFFKLFFAVFFLDGHCAVLILCTSEKQWR